MITDAIDMTAVAAATVVAAAVDMKTRKVPNWLTFGVAAAGITMAAAHVSAVSLGGALGGLAVGLLLMLPGHVIGKTGAGDVKLLAAVGTLLGPQSTALAFLYTTIAGAAIAVIVALMRKRLRQTIESTVLLMQTGGAHAADIEQPARGNRFAYAPAIAIGTIVAAIWR